MSDKKNFFDKALFEGKYALYGDMLYRLGIIYFGLEKDNQMCREAISEAFLWLLTRKKAFKSPECERLELIKHMILICESKCKRKRVKKHESVDEACENALSTEYMDMLEAAYSLPIRYKSVVHLALYEKLSISCISRLLYIIEPIVKSRLKKGVELMEMTLEKEVSVSYYSSMLGQLEPPEGMKEELFLCLSSPQKIKRYATPLQKAEIILSTAALALVIVMLVRNYSRIEYALRVKYYLLSESICSVTLDNLLYISDKELFVTYDGSASTKYQLYTIKKGSLKHVEARYISDDIYFSGQKFHLQFLCYNDDNSLKVIPYDNFSSSFLQPVYSSIDDSTENVLITLNYTNNERYCTYPLILNINTIETTDFLKGCRLLDLGDVSDIKVNSSLTDVIAMTHEGYLYYCNVNSSSVKKIATHKDSYLTNVNFLDDGNILYSIEAPGSAESLYTINYYDYSPHTGTARPCYSFTFPYGFGLLHSGSSSTVIPPDEICAIDVLSRKATTIPITDQEKSSSIHYTESPDGKHIMLQCQAPGQDHEGFDHRKVNSIYIYDTETCKTTLLELSDYKGIEFRKGQWFGNDHIVLEMHPASAADSPSQTSASGAALSNKVHNTFWIFDISRLK